MDTVTTNESRGIVSHAAEKWIRISAIIAMIVVAVSSAILSFDGLQKLALASQIPEHLAFLFPIAVDTTILMGSLAVLLYELFGIKAIFGWFTVLFGTALSVVGNVISVVDTGIIAQVLHGIIPVLLCISLESLLRILRANIRKTVSIAEDNSHLIEKVNTSNSIQYNDETVSADLDKTLTIEPVADTNHEQITLKNIRTSDVSSNELVEENTSPITTEDTQNISTHDKMEQSKLSQKVLKNESSNKSEPVQSTKTSSTSNTIKKSSKRNKVGGQIPLLSDSEKEKYKSKVEELLQQELPAFKVLGEIMQESGDLASNDIRYIFNYEDGKRVDSLVSRARKYNKELSII